MVSFDPMSKYLHHLNRNAETKHVTAGVTRPTGQGPWCLELERHYHDLEQGNWKHVRYVRYATKLTIYTTLPKFM